MVLVCHERNSYVTWTSFNALSNAYIKETYMFNITGSLSVSGNHYIFGNVDAKSTCDQRIWLWDRFNLLSTHCTAVIRSQLFIGMMLLNQVFEVLDMDSFYTLCFQGIWISIKPCILERVR